MTDTVSAAAPAMPVIPGVIYLYHGDVLVSDAHYADPVADFGRSSGPGSGC
jgi:hypothetical protein